jgi:hypothetical protein
MQEDTLVDVNVPTETPAGRSPSIADSPFAGLWKNRQDIADSVEYVDHLRRELHG